MKSSYVLCVCAILSATGSAQTLTFGVQGGAPAQLPLRRSTTNMPFTVGPTVTLRILKRVSFDSGLLYHRLGDRTDTFAFQSPQGGVTLGSERWRGKAIEVPLLVRFGLLSDHRRWQPFLSVGAAVRRTSLNTTGVTTIFSATPVTTQLGQPAFNSQQVKWNTDPVVGAGVSFRGGRFRFEPQIRYSYWGAGKNSPVLQNQVHLLLGIRF